MASTAVQRTDAGYGAASQLSGPQKAAVLLISLGSEHAAEIFRHLKETEVEPLSLEMAKMRRVPPTTSAAVYSTRSWRRRRRGLHRRGRCRLRARGAREVDRGDRAAEILGRLSATIERRPFEFLRRTPPDQIYTFLRNEPADDRASCSRTSTPPRRARALRRCRPSSRPRCRCGSRRWTRPGRRSSRSSRRWSRRSSTSLASHEYATAGGVKLARRRSSTPPIAASSATCSTSSRETNPELANEIRALMFIFEDILKLDDRSIQLVLKDVDTKDLALALRGADEEVKERIMGNMSERGAEMLREEMEFMPPQRRRVVEEAQSRIVAAVRKPRGGGRDRPLPRRRGRGRRLRPRRASRSSSSRLRRQLGERHRAHRARRWSRRAPEAEGSAQAARRQGREEGYAAGLEQAAPRVRRRRVGARRRVERAAHGSRQQAAEPSSGRPPSWRSRSPRRSLGTALEVAARARASTSSQRRAARDRRPRAVVVVVHPEDLDPVARRPRRSPAGSAGRHLDVQAERRVAPAAAASCTPTRPRSTGPSRRSSRARASSSRELAAGIPPMSEAVSTARSTPSRAPTCASAAAASRPDRPRDRGHRPARVESARSAWSRPAAHGRRSRGGRRLPRRPHAADAARRAARRRPRARA